MSSLLSPPTGSWPVYWDPDWVRGAWTPGLAVHNQGSWLGFWAPVTPVVIYGANPAVPKSTWRFVQFRWAGVFMDDNHDTQSQLFYHNILAITDNKAANYILYTYIPLIKSVVIAPIKSNYFCLHQ